MNHLTSTSTNQSKPLPRQAKAAATSGSKAAPRTTPSFDLSKFKLVRVLPERDEEEDDEFEDDEDEDPELDYECRWLRRVRYDIVGPKRKVFGRLRIWLIDLEAIRGSFYAYMDEPSSECMRLAFALFDSRGYLKSQFRREGSAKWGPEVDGPRLAYLEEIEINQTEQGQGVGSWALKEIWKYNEGYPVEGLEDIDFLFTQPSVLNSAEQEILRETLPSAEYQAQYADEAAKIVSFFRKANFRRVGTTAYFCCSRDPDHDSRKVPIAEDAEYKEPKTPKEVRRHEKEGNASFMQMRAQAGW